MTVESCPVCHGTGTVPGGFYYTTGRMWESTGTTSEACRSCGGKGYVVIE